MSLQPSRPLLDTLRNILREMEADPSPKLQSIADLKRLLRLRIAELEATHRLTVSFRASRLTQQQSVSIRGAK